MQSLERLEQLPGVGGFEASAVIADEKAAARGLIWGHPELDGRVVASGGELPRVVQQVLQYRADKRRVGCGPGRLLDGEVHMTVRSLALEFRGDVGDLCPQVDYPGANLGSRNAREVEEVVDELRHPLAGGLDPLGVADGGVAEAVPAVVKQGATQPAHGSQRGTQVVGDRIGEGLQVSVRDLEVV